MHISILIFLILQLIHPSSPLDCPNKCNQICLQPNSSPCRICLRTFYQTYNTILKKCECLLDYSPSLNLNEYCCFENCKSCGSYGCSSCWSNANLVLLAQTNELHCVCEQNYFVHQKTKHCHCLSTTNSSGYYYDREYDICHKCPLNCTCSDKGCISCQETENREVKVNKYGRYTCSCREDLKEKDLVCSCPSHCSCKQNIIIECSSESIRKYQYGKWLCPDNFLDLNGQCRCDTEKQPFYLTINPYNQSACLCKSKNLGLQKLYYQYKGECRSCMSKCSCDERGCYKCQENSYVKSINNVCVCVNNFTYAYKNCDCIFPYYTSRKSDKSADMDQCYCLSEKHPSQYYYIKQTQSCLICPSQCTCDATGCVSCKSGFLRQVVKSNERSTCLCKTNSKQTQQNRCRCQYLFEYDNVTDSCKCEVTKINFTFQDIEDQKCQVCPSGCSCDEQGCFFCEQQLLRSISKNTEGRFTCYCRKGTIESSQKLCICPPPLSWNITIQECRCQLPYYLDNSNNCLCSTNLNTSLFYLNPLTNTCHHCPFNCVCNNQGCIQCSSDSLRYILKTSINTSICPCKSHTFPGNNRCIYIQCPITSYYYSGQCIPCLSCQTCDKRGCLSCQFGMYLSGVNCVCQNDILHNIAGKCVCQEGLYYHPYKSSCEICPMNCNQCQFVIKDDYYLQEVTCLSCPINAWRNQNPKVNCKCIDGYIEIYPLQKVCCPIGCEACNQTACFSCNQYSNRVVINGSCQCPLEMIEVDSTCVCKDGSYLFDSECKACLLGCEKCYYDFNASSIVCTQCKQKVNRNLSSETCQCLESFKQTQFVRSDFCINNFCARDQLNCTECIYPYVPSGNLCICPIGMYSGNICLPCSTMKGCIECQNRFSCSRCNETEDYFLTYPKCVKLNIYDFELFFNYSQAIIQFKSTENINNIVRINNILIRPIYSYIKYNQTNIQQSIYVSAHKVEMIQDIITVRLSISKSFSLSFIVIDGTFSTSTNLVVNHTFNVMATLNKKISILTENQALISRSIAIASLLLSFVIYVAGYKHNQFIFLLQTLSFCSFKLSDTLINNIHIVNQLKYVYYNFENKMVEHAFENNYFEESKGNYYFLTIDSNIFRVLAIAIIVAFFILTILFIFLISFLISINFIIKIKKLRFTKYFFRSIEFFYKTTMYPLIFFALQNIINWNRKSYFQNQIISTGNFFSLLILCIYVFSTLIQYTSILTSKFYKRISLLEIISPILCSLFIITCGEKYWIIPVTIVILAKNLIYYALRQAFLRDKCCDNPFHYIPFVVQLAVLIVILFPVEVYVILILLGVLVVAEVLVSFFIIRNYDREGDYDKQRGFMRQPTPSINQVTITFEEEVQRKEF